MKQLNDISMKFNTIDDLKAPVSRDSFQWLNCKPTVRQYPEQQECIWLSIQGKIYPSFSGVGFQHNSKLPEFFICQMYRPPQCPIFCLFPNFRY